MRGWLYDHARVRPALEALVRAFDLGEALGAPDRLDLRVTQLRVVDSDAWAGTAAPPPLGAVAIAVQHAYGATVPARVAGLVVDAWTETTPAATHTTGLALHYDKPRATPPQVVLVAVAPDVDPLRQPATWDLDTLLDVLTSTLALARDRAVAAERRRVSGLTILDDVQ